MHKLVAGVILSGMMVLGLQCSGESTTETPAKDTEVRVRSELTDITLSGNLQVDSVITYGLVIGDVSFGRVDPGETTDYEVSDEYGPVDLSADSLVVYAQHCDPQLGCVSAPHTVRDVGIHSVDLVLYGNNTVTLDETVIPLDDLFGATRVRVGNTMLDITISFGSSTTVCDSVHLYGLTVANCSFDQVLAGDTTVYVACDSAGTLALAVDSIVGIGDLLGEGTVLLWDTVAPLEVNIDALVSNTIRLGAGSTLTSNLGTPTDVRTP